MPFTPPKAIQDLTFAEWMAWAMSVWGGIARVPNREAPRAKDFDYGTWPTRVHAFWLCSMGLADANSVYDVVSSGAHHSTAKTSMGRIYQGLALGDAFEAFCAAAAIPEEVVTYAFSMKQARKFSYDSFSAKNIDAAIESWPDITDTYPPEPRIWAKAHPPGIEEVDESRSTAAQSDAAVPEGAESGGCVRLMHDGRRIVVRVTTGKMQLVAGETGQGAPLIATSGTFLAHRVRDLLRVARVNRISGRTSEWTTPVNLGVLADGDVLAIDSAGSADLGFVWSSDAGTDVYIARHRDSTVELVEHLSHERASRAVLKGTRALLTLASAGRRGGDCSAFPDIEVTTILAATAAGRTTILASGVDGSGQAAAWVELDGRTRQQVQVGSSLELRLGTQHPPAVVSNDRHTAPLSPVAAIGEPYEHWVPQPPLGHAATA